MSYTSFSYISSIEKFYEDQHDKWYAKNKYSLLQYASFHRTRYFWSFFAMAKHKDSIITVVMLVTLNTEHHEQAHKTINEC